MKENLSGLSSPQAGIEDDFTTGLQAWVDDATAHEGERERRAEAMRRIIEAKSSRSASLSLDGLGLSSLPVQIGDLTELTSLNLSRNQLDTVPAELFKLTNLTLLKLNRNQLNKLPPEIERLTVLENLQLLGNRFNTLPAELFKLTNLTLLNLSWNQLNKISAEIGKLAALRDLYLHNNQLTELSAEILGLPALKDLSLSSNRLVELPAEIVNLTVLTRFNLWGNDQLTISQSLLDRLSELKARGCWVGYPNHLHDHYFTTGLQDWVDDATAHEGEKEGRAEAMRRIIEAKSSRSAILSLDGLGLSSLPGQIGDLTKLTSLNLSNNQLDTLPPEIWKLDDLTNLDLSRNNQLNISPPLLDELSQLEAGGCSVELPDHFLEHRAFLTGLRSWAEDTAAPEEERRARVVAMKKIIEAKFSRSASLSLDGLGLSSLPVQIGDLTELTSLNLSRNRINILPAEIRRLTVLENLDLSANQLNTIPPEIWDLTTLTRLGLAANQLDRLPAEIAKLTALKSLNLYSNQLAILPAEFVNLTALKELSLGSNQLETFPLEITKLNALESLFLGFNGLSTLPLEFSDLAALTRLDLAGNQLDTFPAEIAKIKTLKSLNLYRNRIAALPAELVNLNALESLNLNSNQLETFPAEICLPTLKDLSLGDNRLADLPEEIFNLAVLTRFDLSGNDQLNISQDLLDRLSDLEKRNCNVEYPYHFYTHKVALTKSHLKAIGAKYKEYNSIAADNPIQSTTRLLQRFLDENIENRGGFKEILQAATPPLDVLERNPNHLKWVEEIAELYISGCVNQPVGGWSAISALASIAAAPTMLEKLEAAKHLLTLDLVKDFVSRNFNSQGVEIEAGNALLREEHAILLSEGVIKKPWLAVPGPIAHEEAVARWLTERVQEFHEQIRPLLQKTPQEMADFLLHGVHCITWGEINFPEQLREINDSYEQDRAKRWDEIEKIEEGPKKNELTENFVKEQKALTNKNEAIIYDAINTLNHR
jgi:Leucine-rich repeat (LRR) protein